MYSEKQIRDLIIETINKVIEKSNNKETITKYREPVIGFASASDALYDRASEIIGYKVFHPTDILPEAKTVASFFVPFEEQTVKYARARGPFPTNKEWSLGYYELNMLIGKIMAVVVNELKAVGVKSETEPVTDNYNHIDLTTSWPHKTTAYIAGLGTFGINRVIITPMGSAGRLGSIVFDQEITPTKRPSGENCYYKEEGKCGICAKRCATTAIRYNSFSRFMCNEHDVIMRDDPSTIDRGCPLCNAAAPCGFYRTPKIKDHHIFIGRKSCDELRGEI